jgi:phosphoribosylanthranilate isomerase
MGKRFMGRGIRVKICGITCVEDLDAAVEAGADAVGLNFHPTSPRFVPAERAITLVERLPPFVEPVAVFVKKTVREAAATANPAGMRTIQIHGGSPETINAFPARYIPAFQLRDRADLVAIDAYLETCRQASALPAAILVDGHAPGLHGGTGQRAPWDLLADWRPLVPLLLAGGLTPDNVAEAVRRVKPWAVDVASGVESSPGRKDAEKMRRFVEAARAAER